MKHLISLVAMVFAWTIGMGNAAAVTVNFNQAECPSCISKVPVTGNEWDHFGLTVANAYWYADSRDTFDNMGLSINSSPAVISFAAVANWVKFDYWVVDGYQGRDEAFDSAHKSLGSFLVDASATTDLLGSHTFRGAVASLEWTGDRGRAQISAVTMVPEPGTYAMMLLGLGVIGLFGRGQRMRIVRSKSLFS